jgi:hypothetical protein
MSRSFRILLLLGMAAAAGCGRTSPQFESRPTFPVEGSVLIQGKPAEGVHVFLHPADPSQRGKPRGVTDGGGRFRLRTYREDDGAPAGNYAVTVYWPARHGPDVANDDQLPPDRLAGRFINPKTTSLRATVGAGPTTLPPLEIP